MTAHPFVAHTTSRALYGSAEALPLLLIDTPQCRAVVALQGAQVLEFTRKEKGEKPWFWLSPKARFVEGEAIRGGIPLCLPWFGVNREDPKKPKHGFVRQRPWQLDAVHEEGGAVTLLLSFHYNRLEPSLFTTPFSATLAITLSDALSLALSFTNLSQQAAGFSFAFHSYFAVESIETTVVEGLAGRTFLDNTRALSPHIQQGAITFGAEVDRVYEGTVTAQQLTTAAHSLLIEGNGCPTCIVWNPGPAVASTLADIGEGFQRFACVERGAAFADTITLAAGEIASARLLIREKLAKNLTKSQSCL